MRAARWPRLVLPLALAAALAFAVKATSPHGGLVDTVLTPRVLQYVGALSKLVFLFLSAVFAWSIGGRFEPGNPVRPAWRLLGLGGVTFFLGQVSFAPYQLVKNEDPPYPSIADVFFMLAYPLFVAALFAFIRAYRVAGYAIGTPAARLATAAVVVAVCALAGYAILRPVLRAPATPLAQVLNVAYPVLDFLLLIPTVLLIRIAVALRGGAAWKIWAALLAGFVFLCLGDIAFAYLSALGHEALDPVIHALYVLAYGLMARGVLHQHELLAS
jgi:hypothetical protein